ncbi:peptide chain release factor N(5)-glutamine methyltransferase [candidate division WWE3 bacterium]|uniref:Peptide chain release factor N(5)-glutamine methyltransferase n=1 Tax=candidate division WWE3 bacterium TaxID=2053526 RepID=A0A955LJN9_UNCKA|nr:peptide chain release factor N(5)-glutamine methyltransferase [candidate division WWE3 bacterium]
MGINELILQSKLPLLETQLIMSFILKREVVFVVAHPDYSLSQGEVTSFEQMYTQRLAGRPLEYILGRKEFYGRDFAVNEDVLIPRPESEEIVDRVLSHIQDRITENNRGEFKIVDLGTGSGILAVTIALELKERFGSALSSVAITAVDVSGRALTVARRNAHKLGAGDNVRFVQGDLFSAVGDESFDIIVANLPYLPTTESRDNRFEPQSALDGGVDGNDLNNRLQHEYERYLNPGGVLVFEGYGGEIKVTRAVDAQ